MPQMWQDKDIEKVKRLEGNKKMNNEDVIYEFCKNCNNLIGCLELIRAPEPNFKVKCPCFNALKLEITGKE